ncbi:MAG: HAD family hydrolase [Dehalococcoidales bacterium]|nr:MAG: HAD family hydrolase [Dehalococcoidales bacterium]
MMIPFSGIRAIAFDTDGTLVDFIKVMRHSLEFSLREMEKHHSGASTRMNVNRMIEIRDAVAELSGSNVVDFKAVRLESFRQILAIVGRPEESLAYRLYSLYMKHRYEDIEVYEDIIPVLDLLKGRYVLGLHSNGNSYPELCGLDGYFDFTVFSEECGIEKPDPGFYRIVLERAGCSSEELLNISDSLHNDVAAAASVGIRSIWLNRSGEERPQDIDVEFEIQSLSELPKLLDIDETQRSYSE